MIKIKKTVKFAAIFIFCLAFILTPAFVNNVSSFQVKADTADQLAQQLAQLQAQLDAIKKQRAQVDSQLQKENSNQTSLSSQISFYDTKIQSTQLAIDEKSKYIETLETQIALLKAQITDLQNQITDLQKKIEDLKQLYDDRVRDQFRSGFVSNIDTFIEVGDFETYLVQKEFANTLAQQDQKLSEDLNSKKTELDVAKKQLDESLQKQTDLQTEVKAEYSDLSFQKQGMIYQKSQKGLLLQTSQKNAAELAQQKADLIAQSKIAENQQNELLMAIISVRGNGTPVRIGDPIGRMGRSGYVLNCNGNYCYYPNPDTEPCGGAHLHLEVAKKYTDGRYYRTNPLPYLQNSAIQGPLRSFYYTQYYQGDAGSYGSFTGFNNNGVLTTIYGHPGIDIVGDSNCGTTIYSGVNGVISYYCNRFQYGSYRRDDTFLAVVYDPVHDINVTYMHLQKPQGMQGCPI